MQRRMTKVTALVAVLLLGLFAAPAAAQQANDETTVDVEVDGDVVEGVTALQCSVAVAQGYADGNLPVFNEVFGTFFPAFDEDTGDVGEPDPAREQELVNTTVAFLAEDGQTLEDVCSIYIVEVLPEVEEKPETEPEPEPVAVEEDPPTDVMGVSMQRTGIDSLLMAAIGAGLLGLGVVAVRRTREEDNPA